MSRRQTAPIDETRDLVGRHLVVGTSRLQQKDLRM
jgi:hypothetical protein